MKTARTNDANSAPNTDNTPEAPGAHTMELLLPAGSPEALYAAIEGGADAVYLGLDHFSARGRAKNFSRANFLAACHLTREKGVKLYLALNTLVKNDELPLLIETLVFAAAAGVDAIIVQDWGVFYIIKKYFPDIPVHASTQMALHTSLGARMAARLGFARAVLARELTLSEIAAVAREKAVAIEVFVHGALCYSLSGHCLMSSFIGGMSANRGFCRQPCRRRYALSDNDEQFAARQEEGLRDVRREKGIHSIRGENSIDKFPDRSVPQRDVDFPFFNLRDLELIDYLGALQKVGVDSLKIEGRMKPAEYVYHTAKAYRLALDNPRNIREAKAILHEDLAREKTAYFVGGLGDVQNAFAQQSYTGRVIGRIEKITPRGFTITLQSKISTRDRLRIQPASGEDSISFRAAEIRVSGQSLEFAEEAQQVEIIPHFAEAIDTLTPPNASRAFIESGGDLRAESADMDSDPSAVSAGVDSVPRADSAFRAGVSDMNGDFRAEAIDTDSVSHANRISRAEVSVPLVAHEATAGYRASVESRFAEISASRTFAEKQSIPGTVSAETFKTRSADTQNGGLRADRAVWMKNFRAGDLVLKVGSKELRFPSRLPGSGVSDFAQKIMPPAQQRRIYDEILRQAEQSAAQSAHTVQASGESELIMRIDTLAWLAKVQPEKLDALILDFTLEDWAQVQFSRPSIERNRDRFVLQLPLFIPEKSLPHWRKIVERFYAAGCTSFMASQVWQLPLLEGLSGIGIWAAETVYCLNAAAAVFLDSIGFERRVLPLENDARNLQTARDLSGVVPLYCRPRLFVSRVCGRTGIPGLSVGEVCCDRSGEYMAEVRDGLLMLTSALPVSWFQYRPALEDAGYSRFLIDLSSEKPSQHTFSRMLRLFGQGEAAQPSCAFNYKDGLS